MLRRQAYLFVSGLWFCHLHVISLLTINLHSDWRRVIGKIKQNELDFRDTAPLIRKFIHGSEAEENKLKKRNELLITESQCDFFCFIPSAWVKNSKLANTKMTSSAYLPCFGNAGLRRMSLFVSRAKHEPEPSMLEPASSLQAQMFIFSLFLNEISNIPSSHILLSAT